MLVSVIMTARNTQDYIRDAIESVLASTHEELELLVIDDGSSDDTATIARSMATQDDRIRFEARPAAGRRAALEYAHSLANGEALAWVDSDDVVHPDGLRACLELLDGDHQLVYTHRRLIDQDGHDRGAHQKNLVPYDAMQLLVSNMIFHLRVYTRELYDAAGGVGELSSAIDWDMNLRMTEHTQPLAVDRDLYSYRVRPGRMSGTAEQATNGQRAVRNAIARRGLDVELIVRPDGWHLRRTSSTNQR